MILYETKYLIDNQVIVVIFIVQTSTLILQGEFDDFWASFSILVS